MKSITQFLKRVNHFFNPQPPVSSNRRTVLWTVNGALHILEI